MNRKAILDKLSKETPTMRAQFGVRDLALFGSYGRDEARRDSDLDVLVAFEGKADFDRFMGLKLHLEDLFGLRIDLVTHAALRPELREIIEAEAVHVP